MTARPLNFFRMLGSVFFAILLWLIAVTGFVVLTEKEIVPDGPDTASLIGAAKQDVTEHRGNLALVVVEGGQVSGTRFMSIGQPVDADSVFQMASVSKWVTAWGVMTLVEAGKVDLDAPVSRYLRRWQLPITTYNNDLVTVRRLLSHTAGLRDGLGYCGFAPGQPVQALEASLTKAADACPFRSGTVLVSAIPGEWYYSGGGYSLLQLMIEDVTGQAFADYMDATVLKPLGMNSSTFRTGAEGTKRVAEFFDVDGSPAPHFLYTAAAAASLYSSASDFAKFVNAHRAGVNGSVAGRGVLSTQSIEALIKPNAILKNNTYWGLGVRLYAPNGAGGFIIGHDGGNAPAVNNSVRLDLASGNAIIAFSTGGSGIATRLTKAWLQQRVASSDLPKAGFNPFSKLGQLWAIRQLILSGIIFIIIAGVIWMWRFFHSNLHVKSS